MTKGERLYKDMKALGEIGHGHGQRGSNIEEWRRIKKFLDKRSIQVGRASS
jgi:hypothetical protein